MSSTAKGGAKAYTRATWWVKIEAKGNVGHGEGSPDEVGSRFVENTAMERLAGVIAQAFEYRRAQKALLEDHHDCRNS